MMAMWDILGALTLALLAVVAVIALMLGGASAWVAVSAVAGMMVVGAALMVVSEVRAMRGVDVTPNASTAFMRYFDEHPDEWATYVKRLDADVAACDACEHDWRPDTNPYWQTCQKCGWGAFDAEGWSEARERTRAGEEPRA